MYRYGHILKRTIYDGNAYEEKDDCIAIITYDKLGNKNGEFLIDKEDKEKVDMLKYLYSKVVFSEIPEEITLGISISGCKIRCSECHSQELWEDKGTPLTIEEIERLLEKNKGVTCLLLLGGEHDINYLIYLFEHFHSKIKTAWYCGLDKLPRNTKKIENYLTWIKMGRYIKELGGLDSPNTNQRLYWILHHKGKNIRYNLTKKLQKK